MSVPEHLQGPFFGASIDDLACSLRAGETTAVHLAERALVAARGVGSDLGCFVTLDDACLAQAEIHDQELAAGLDRGPLHGIPVGVKDMIATNGLRTTMGSRHFAEHVPAADAVVVTRLREAGAVVIGKTVTHEFAYGPTGDRGLGGPSRNPQDPELMAGGSSAGSGAAVAAGIVPLALGTDTGGSVRIPAALCGCVGLRPGTGTLTNDGVFPLSPTLDVVGVLANSPADTLHGWRALSRTADAARPEQRFDHRPLRVGIVRSSLTERVVPRQRRALQQAVDVLRATGAECVDAALPEFDDCLAPYAAIQSAEVYALHRRRVEADPDLFDPEVLERISAAESVRGWEYVAALEQRAQLQESALRRITGLDALILPTVPVLPPRVNQRDDLVGADWPSPRAALLGLTSSFSVLGWPAVAVPVTEQDQALAGSVQLAGRPGSEEILLKIGAAVAG